MSTFSIFKAASVVAVAVADKQVFGQPITKGVVASIGLLAAFALSSSDLQTSVFGSLMAVASCFLFSAYVLAMKSVQQATGMTPLDQAFYNNLLSFIVFAAMALKNGEATGSALNINMASSPVLWAMLAAAGVVRALASTSVAWIITHASPTTFAIINTLDTIPGSTAAILFYASALSWHGIATGLMSLASGASYAWGQLQDQPYGKLLSGP